MEQGEMVIDILKTLKKIHLLLKHNMEQEFKEFNLTAPQGTLITYLIKYGNLRITDLSKKMRTSSSTVSGIIDRLEGQGYVKRIRSDSNRREVVISLSDNFKDEFEKRIKKKEGKLTALVSKTSEKELQEIYLSLKKLEAIINNSSELNPEIKGEKNA